MLPAFKPQWDARKGAEQLLRRLYALRASRSKSSRARYQRISHIKKLIAEGVLGDDLRQRDRRRPPKHALAASGAGMTWDLPAPMPAERSIHRARL